MNADDLRTVQGSWCELSCRRSSLHRELTRCFEAVGSGTIEPDRRATWLLDSVAQLVELLPSPSALASRARDLGATWPDPGTAPCFAVEGRAWLAAGEACLPGWTQAIADAWQQAWLLLSEELAAEALSPFADLDRDDARGR